MVSGSILPHLSFATDKSLVTPMLPLGGLDFTGKKFRNLVEIALGRGQFAGSPINKPFISNLRGMRPADAEVKQVSSMKVPFEFLSLQPE